MRSDKRNQDLRDDIQKTGLFMIDVAESLKISESTLYRWLRTDMPEVRKRKILTKINELKQNLQEAN